VQGKLKLAVFRPASGLNPDILKRYNANRLRVVRQVRYSLYNEKSIDLVLFLNGIAVRAGLATTLGGMSIVIPCP
jgi:type I restriction enzyme R subunit